MDHKTAIAVDAYLRLQRAERLLNEKRAELNRALSAGIDVAEYYRATEQF